MFTNSDCEQNTSTNTFDKIENYIFTKMDYLIINRRYFTSPLHEFKILMFSGFYFNLL